jgi:hypothetical protein
MTMGRPPTTVALCYEVHSLLLENGIPIGAKMPRPLWDKLLAQGRHVSWAQTRNITQTGVQHGLWTLQGNAGRVPGSVALLPLPQGADLMSSNTAL